MKQLVLISSLMLSSCIQEIGPGPDLGACAEYPDGAYTFGQAGIGTCLAGPADMHFVEQDGRTWIAVTNADPYKSFLTGSLLLIDFDSIDLSRTTNRMDTLEAYGLPLDSYLGGIGHIDDRDLLLVSSRHSEDGATRSFEDDVFVVDMADPTNLALWDRRETMTLKDDPHPIEVYPSEDLAFVGNLTDHSVSVINTESYALSQVDIAPEASIQPGTFVGSPNSVGLGELDNPIMLDPTLMVDDQWTLTYVEGTYRFWLPELDGLQRWNSGGLDYTPSGYGLELQPSLFSSISEIRDPYVVLSDALPLLIFSDEGTLRSALSQGQAGDWDLYPTALVSGVPEGAVVQSGPCLIGLDETFALYFDGASASDPDLRSIWLATAIGEEDYELGDSAIITPPEGYVSIAQPFVRNDGQTGLYRMWMSLWDGSHWSIGLSESADGYTWDTPTAVLEDIDEDYANPVIIYSNSHYIMWLTIPGGENWEFAVAQSYDGVHWTTPESVLVSPHDLQSPPPRIALQYEAARSWRVEGIDQGSQPFPAFSGSTYTDAAGGFSFSVANGQEMSNDQIGDEFAEGGLYPSSAVLTDDGPVLFLTVVGADEFLRIASVQSIDGVWGPHGNDLTHGGAGQSALGSQSPVVWRESGTWVMFYAGTNAESNTHILRATSTDGLEWTTDNEPVFSSTGDWDSILQLPHSLEALEDGGFKLWYTGYDGDTYRIGSAITDSSSLATATFLPVSGGADDFLFAPGVPGSFDDSGVKDPAILVKDDTTYMLYSGFDGEFWHIGLARLENGEWVRTGTMTGDTVNPVLTGQPRTFSALGVENPVLLPEWGADSPVWYSGHDGLAARLGAAQQSGEFLFSSQRFPLAGDTLSLRTTRGDDIVSVIELEQNVDGFTTAGTGMASMTIDVARGFLYVASKLSNALYVLDIRDDSTNGFVDENYMDIEALLEVSTVTSGLGFRDIAIVPGEDILYASTHDPDGLVVLDLSLLEDNGEKELIHSAALDTILLPGVRNDVGIDTYASIGGAGIALSPDQRFLIATNFTDNSVSIFDRTLGLYGEEIRYIADIGENPHLVSFSPDGRYAVVANYVGEAQGTVTSSTLAVLDMQPDSETFLQVLTWVINHN